MRKTKIRKQNPHRAVASRRSSVESCGEERCARGYVTRAPPNSDARPAASRPWQMPTFRVIVLSLAYPYRTPHLRMRGGSWGAMPRQSVKARAFLPRSPAFSGSHRPRVGRSGARSAPAAAARAASTSFVPSSRSRGRKILSSQSVHIACLPVPAGVPIHPRVRSPPKSPRPAMKKPPRGSRAARLRLSKPGLTLRPDPLDATNGRTRAQYCASGDT